MPSIRTIDHNYDYQMIQAAKLLAKDYEVNINDMTPGEMMAFIYDHREEFGRMIICHMSEWQDDEDWYFAAVSYELP